MDFEVLPELKEVSNTVINYMTQFCCGAFTLPDTNGLFTFTDPDTDTGNQMAILCYTERFTLHGAIAMPAVAKRSA